MYVIIYPSGICDSKKFQEIWILFLCVDLYRSVPFAVMPSSFKNNLTA